MANPTGKGGKPFVKGDPRIQPNLSGRKPDSPEMKKAKERMREALPRLLLLNRSAFEQHISNDPPMYDILAAKYINDHVSDTVARLLGPIPKVVTGEGGEPLIPPAPPDFSNWTEKQVDAYIAATAAVRAASASTPPAP